MDKRSWRILVAWISSDIIWASLFIRSLKRAEAGRTTPDELSPIRIDASARPVPSV